MAWKNYPKSYGKKSKYGANKAVVDGITFDSRKEARRYSELKLLERVGEISDLQLQVKFVLIPAQREPDTVGKRGGVIKGKLIERECSYVADFTYKGKDGLLHVEDVKGYKDGSAYNLFKIKRKLMLYIHKIKVEEV